jgi:hypothetical protein
VGLSRGAPGPDVRGLWDRPGPGVCGPASGSWPGVRAGARRSGSEPGSAGQCREYASLVPEAGSGSGAAGLGREYASLVPEAGSGAGVYGPEVE